MSKSHNNTGLRYVYHIMCVVCGWDVPLLEKHWKRARAESLRQGWHQTKRGYMCPQCYRSYTHDT
jgi:hypothetical protein